jgi:hypothetical protein
MFGLFLIIWLPILVGVIVFIPSFLKWQRGYREKDQLSMQTGRTLSLISFTVVTVLLIIWWAVSNPT